MQMPPKVKKIWEIASTVVVILFVLAAIFLLGSRLLGFEVYNVISGSMSPDYKVGTLVYVKSVDPLDIEKGDDITFVMSDGKTVSTHRVYEKTVKGDEIYYTTYGIANLSAEEREMLKTTGKLPEDALDTSPVYYKNVQGVVKFSVPLLGYVSDYISHPPGTWVAIGGVVVLIILAFLPDTIAMVFKKKPEEKNEENADHQQGSEQ